MNDDDLHDFLDDGPPDEEGPEKELASVDEMIRDGDSKEYVPSDYTQLMLLSYLVAVPDLWVTCSPIIKEEYFDREFRPVVRRIFDHMKKYKDMPDPMMIHAETGVKLEDVKEKAQDERRQQWLVDSVEEFCRTQAYMDHLIESAEIIASDKSRDALAGLLKKAQEIGKMSLHRDLGFEVHESIGEILTESKDDDNISTGLDHLDRALSGGISRPSFNLVSAGSGDGKSIFMMNMGMYAMERGENVIYYSLELQPAIIMKRFGAMMTDTDINSIYANMEGVVMTMRNRRKKEGQMYIVRFPISGTTTADITAHHLELSMKTGLHFGVVCVDYIDLMTPVELVDKSNIHLKDKYVAEELNDWTHDNRLITWSASQQTKGADDEKGARKSGVSGGTPKINTCDNLIIGKRNDEDKENETWWAHIEKNRDGGGTKRQVPIRWDSKTQKMTNGSLDDFMDANPDLFGRKSGSNEKKSEMAERIGNDPLVKEQGIVLPADKPKVGSKEKKKSDVLSKLQRKISAGAIDD